MQLVILHHHLNPGGVTRVIQNHLLSLATAPDSVLPQRVLLLHGGRAVGWPPEELNRPLPFTVEAVAVKGLDYSGLEYTGLDGTKASANRELATSIQATLTRYGCTPETTLLHWHNHSLGKNSSTPLAASELAQQGFRTLLQIHDFAEDFRPNNYSKLVASLARGQAENLPELLYPQAAHIHYATLNQRDYQVLGKAGVDDARLHLLPNPVAPPAGAADAQEARQLVRKSLSVPPDARLLTYPVRGIRRKNLGEFLLWSAVSEQAFFHLSLVPESPAERAAFDQWAQLAKELELPCQLGRPEACEFTFDQLLAASDALVTTSVAEGFGMVFLEAWLARRRLLGRNLPEISADFCAVGLDLGELYDGLKIPIEWLNRKQLIEGFGEVVAKIYHEFSLPLPTPAGIETVLDEPTVDFARLPIAFQQDVIRKVSQHADDREHLLELNPRLRLSFGDTDKLTDELTKKIINANSEVVRQNYSLEALGQRLSEVYNTVWNSPPDAKIVSPANGQKILHSFLQIDRLHPVRVQ